MCFNGAATLSLRKLASSVDRAASMSLLQWGRNFIVAETNLSPVWRASYRRLQWGRNFIVAETGYTLTPADPTIGASMGPQLYRCGNYPVTHPFAQEQIRFNGAATLSLRKLGAGAARRRGLAAASMGPQLYRCGNRWPPDAKHDLGPASMGPQLYRCGNPLAASISTGRT